MRYRIESKLGEGATGLIFRATDTSLNRLVALKLLKPTAGARPEIRQRFLREAQVAARMSHPNVVAVYDAGELDGRLFLAMELVKGVPFDQVLAAKKMPLDDRVRVLEGVARGVQHAHEHGVVHRDLKPANIIVSDSGVPKVADFGLAHLIEAETALTQVGSAPIGTPLYMAPEQISGKPGKISARTDVYALGAILYELLTGKAPHEGKTVPEVFGKILNQDVRRPRALNASVPLDLENVCLKALDKDPQRRYRSSGEIAEELSRYLAGEPVLARPMSTGRRVVRWLRRNPAISLLVVVVAVAGFLIASQRLTSDSKLAGLRKLGTLWSKIIECKSDLRLLKARGDVARAGLQRAVNELDAFILERPDDPQGYYVRARGRIYLLNLDGAIQDMREAVRRVPDFRPGWSLLGMALLEKYHEGVQCDPQDWDAAALQFEGVLRDAAAAMKKGWEKGREQAEAERWGLPWTREDEVMERLARGTYLNEVERDVAGSQRIYQEGMAQYKAEEYAVCMALTCPDSPERLKYLDLAIEWAPGYEIAFFNRSTLRCDLREFGGAEADLTHALELRPDWVACYINRTVARMAQGNLEGALADCDQAIRLDPKAAIAWLNRGVARRQKGDLDGARADLERAIELRKEFPRALNNRGLTRQSQGDFAGALVDYNRAIELKRDYPEVYCSRGSLKKHNKDLEGALEDYARAIELRPDYAEAWYNRGVLKNLMKDPNGALADFSMAIRYRPEFVEAWFNRGIIHKQLGDLKAAIADYDQAITLKPAKVEAWFNRGNAKLAMGDLAGALSDYESAERISPPDGPYLERVRENLSLVKQRLEK